MRDGPQTLRDWVHRLNEQGQNGFCDVDADGIEPRLSTEQLAELAAIVKTGPVRCLVCLNRSGPATG